MHFYYNKNLILFVIFILYILYILYHFIYILYIFFYFIILKNGVKMVAGPTEHGIQADVIFVIEGTAVNGAYLNDLKTNYLTPTLE